MRFEEEYLLTLDRHAGVGRRHSPSVHHRLLVDPVVPGSGKRFFKDGTNTTLRLVETRTFPTGVVLLSYQPVGQDGE